MLEVLKSVVLGIIEGITEWLPISSTGHLILFGEFLGLNVSKDFKSMFDVVIQLGAILAVIILFWNKIWPLQSKKENGTLFKSNAIMLWVKIIISCIPAGLMVVLGLDEKCEELFYRPVPIALALIIVGVLFIVIEKLFKNKTASINTLQDITYLQAVLIGVSQVLAAVFPGTSRSGITIIAGLILGLSRSVAAEYTFVLSVPVMAGASLLKLLEFGFSYTALETAILFAGFVSAFVVSLIVIKFLMNFIKKHDFKVFGYYRIALGAIVLLYFALS